MAEQMTLARPYAQAAFDWAKEKNCLDAWAEMLEKMSLLAQDERMMHFVKSRQTSRQEITAGLKMVTEGWVDASCLQFLNALLDNRRFAVLPFIFKRFSELLWEHRRSLQVQVETPYFLSDTLLADLAKALEKRFGQKVALSQTLVSDLRAGVRIRFGDRVLDGSLEGRFQNLKSVLMAV